RRSHPTTLKNTYANISAPSYAHSPPHGPNIPQRTPLSARARQAELPPQLVKYIETGETLVAEPFKGITLDATLCPTSSPFRRPGSPRRPSSRLPGRSWPR